MGADGRLAAAVTVPCATALKWSDVFGVVPIS
jgi:hypothetical protein